MLYKYFLSWYQGIDHTSKQARKKSVNKPTLECFFQQYGKFII